MDRGAAAAKRTPAINSRLEASEGDSQPKSYRPATVDSFLRKAVDQATEIRIGADIRNGQKLPRILIDTDIEIARGSRTTTAAAIIQVR